jgi:phage I-like protein
MARKKKETADEVMIDVGDENENPVDVELDSKGEATITELDENPNVEDQLETATGETDEEDTRTPQERVKEYMEQNDEAAEYSRDVQKRINKFTYDLREAERREKAAIEYAQGVQDEMAALKDRQVQQDGIFINEHKGRIEASLRSAQKQYQEAFAAGDPVLISEANTDIAKFAAQLANAEQTENRFKKHIESKPKNEPKPYVPPAPDTSKDTTNRQAPDPRAVEWAEKNTWFGEDTQLTNAALQIHQQLTTQEGYIPNGEGYYQELDNRLRKNFPKSFTKPKMNGQQVVTGGSTPNRSGQQRGKRNVRLTASQVAVAKKLGVPLEEYAKYV